MNPIKRIRTRILKITQEEFSKAIGKRQSLVSRWETGDCTPMKASMEAILRAYPSLDPAEFFRTDTEEGGGDEKVVLDQDVKGGGGPGPGGKTPTRNSAAFT